MRARFDSGYIRSELERIGEHLKEPLTVFLIGGGSMAFRDLKNTTKDIDLIVTSGTNLAQLQAVLLELDYEIVREPDEEYKELGAQRILENEDGCRIDIFNQQVIDKLVLSSGIQERSERHLNPGNLVVKLVSPEDIFLFKAVAGRVDDIEDMFSLMQIGLDFEVVETELAAQIELLDQELFVTYVNEALAELTEQHNVRTPLHDPVAEITERVYEELEVLHVLDEPKSMSDLQQELEYSNRELQKIMNRLVEKDVVEETNGRVKRLSTTI
ncbi:nucleotidyltransferase [Haloarcula nitratireducens]|uniref:Nucleotidyltransferase n=1 Tax=Haloarcula nitratireducens TaxID=2487749 RepID=A0AAW4PK72_9EURY|nr:nucleotidyltransferase [Halomicroarcula nitratireducens]MBX0298094.1 nucleotidyltransferase [Halomicroarcula nitratireducens]